MLERSDHVDIAVLALCQPTVLQIFIAGRKPCFADGAIGFAALGAEIDAGLNAGGNVIIFADQRLSVRAGLQIAIAEGTEGSQFLTVVGLSLFFADCRRDEAQPQNLFAEAGGNFFVAAEIERRFGVAADPLLLQHVTEVLTRRKRQLPDGGDKEDGNDHFIILSRALRAAVLRPFQRERVQ